jgi:hypothetical protein
MPGYILPSLARSIEKHMAGYTHLLTKPHYQHFKDAIVGIVEGADSLASLSRKRGTPERTWWHFFNESVFDDTILLTQSARVMNHRSQTRTTQQAFVIFDFTSVFKTGAGFEWSDFLWDEETETTDKRGHEQVIALEYDPQKDYRKCLGMRRFYHDDSLHQTEYWRDDFEKKPVTVSRLLPIVRPLTAAAEVLVDGEFLNGAFLINRFEKSGFAWTGRIKKSVLATYTIEGKQPETLSLKDLIEKLQKKKQVRWRTVRYRKQKIRALTITVSIPSFAGRTVRIAVCKNKQGNIAFLGTSILDRDAEEIVRVYGYRWEIEVFFKDIKGNLSFGDYRMRSVGANSRWQIFTLVAANLIELVRKTNVEEVVKSKKVPWFQEALHTLYQTGGVTLGMCIKLLQDIRSGGQEFITALKRCFALHHAKYYLYKRINLARL